MTKLEGTAAIGRAGKWPEQLFEAAKIVTLSAVVSAG
jgi:hypothetical protein